MPRRHDDTLVEDADIGTSSEDYARRFTGAVGRWFIETQTRITLGFLGALPVGASVLVTILIQQTTSHAETLQAALAANSAAPPAADRQLLIAQAGSAGMNDGQACSERASATRSM